MVPNFNAKSRQDLDAKWPAIGAAINRYDDGKGIELVVRRPNKVRDQEAKYHAMIADIARAGSISYGAITVDFSAFAVDPVMAAKALLVVWYEQDLKSQGESLSKPSAWIVDPVTGAPITVRASTKEFSVKEAANFIEFLHAVGAENKVSWSDPETKSYEQWAKEG